FSALITPPHLLLYLFLPCSLYHYVLFLSSLPPLSPLLFFFNDTAPTEIYTLSLHDALPICHPLLLAAAQQSRQHPRRKRKFPKRDRKSTRLNSSHQIISYAVFCLKKKNKKHESTRIKHMTILDQ